MKSLFQREMNESELVIYKKAISHIKEKTENLMDEIDENLKTYNKFNNFDCKFYLSDDSLSIKEKKEYLKQLKEKLLLMGDCDKVKVKVATALHPMCWCYLLNKHLPESSFKEWCFNYIMYGFCVPFKRNKPIMMAYYVFEEGEQEVKDILSHELTHSLMNTKDLNAENHIDALNDAWTIGLLY